MRKYWFVIWILYSLLNSGCVSIKYNDQAKTDFRLAAQAINDLKNDTLVVLFPTMFEQEELLERSLRKHPDKQEYLNKIKQEYLIESTKVRTIFIEMMKKYYDFSHYVFVNDFDIKKFEEGENIQFFDKEGNELNDFMLTNKTPFKLYNVHNTENFKIVVLNELVPNPFPNTINTNYNLPLFFGFVNREFVFEKGINSINKRLHQFYKNPERKKLRY